MTERKYPRTMQEAFPNTVEYGAAIEKPYKGLYLIDKVMIGVSLIGFVVVLLDLFIWRV